MKSEAIVKSLQDAHAALLMAENELSRPQEDVVTLSACNTVRNSLREMFENYLDAHGIKTTLNSSLEELKDQCISANILFRNIDLRNVECKGEDHAHCDGKYCLSVTNVSTCLAVAKQVKGIIWNEFLM